jgi:hypothetical protein
MGFPARPELKNKNAMGCGRNLDRVVAKRRSWGPRLTKVSTLKISAVRAADLTPIPNQPFEGEIFPATEKKNKKTPVVHFAPILCLDYSLGTVASLSSMVFALEWLASAVKMLE